MLDTCASMLATALEWAAAGFTPKRDMVLAFVADEESGGDWGARWLAETHPELFAGCKVALGEDGAQFTPVTGASGEIVRIYPIACSERGAMHAKLRAIGPAGHGSRPGTDDAAARLVRALNRIAEYQWPLKLTKVVKAQLEATASALGLDLDLKDEVSIQTVIAALGDAAGALPWTGRTTAAITVLEAGYKVNVIPGVAEAGIDVRYPSGQFESSRDTLAGLIGEGIEWSFPDWGEVYESDPDSPWFAALAAAIRRADPQAVVVPYCMGGGTDGRWFSELGIEPFGFTPIMQCSAGRATGIHVVDESNVVEGLVQGHMVLRDFLENI
jgi:acetylornithine deacetylase/succinyl-diaminopimelate desuccinylase-like protein